MGRGQSGRCGAFHRRLLAAGHRRTVDAAVARRRQPADGWRTPRGERLSAAPCVPRLAPSRRRVRGRLRESRHVHGVSAVRDRWPAPRRISAVQAVAGCQRVLLAQPFLAKRIPLAQLFSCEGVPSRSHFSCEGVPSRSHFLARVSPRAPRAEGSVVRKLMMEVVAERVRCDDEEYLGNACRRVRRCASCRSTRLIDGREAVRFLVTVKELIEDPARILLEL